MPETITITPKEARETLHAIAPAGFRFALAIDFHDNGARKKYVQIFIHRWGHPSTLNEDWFCDCMRADWLQQQLIDRKVFIKT